MLIEKYEVVKSSTHLMEKIYAGTVCYTFIRDNFGLVAEDNEIYNEPFIAVTLNKFGNYPFFTMPLSSLKKIG